jgi:hypothetical protein
MILVSMALKQVYRAVTGFDYSNALVREGRGMARSDEKVFESIDNLRSAESTEYEGERAGVVEEGKTAVKRIQEIDESLVAGHYDAGRQLESVAHAKWALAVACVLLLLNGALAVLVMLAFGPLMLTLSLAFLVLATGLAVEEFFQAYSEKDTVKETIFLVMSVLALGAMFYLGSLRGLFVAALAPAEAGPATQLLRTAGPVLGIGLGVMSVIAEAMTGYLLWQARSGLLSPAAQLLGERSALAKRVAALAERAKALDGQADANRHYRRIGAQQWLSRAAAMQSDENRHVKTATRGAAIVIALLALGFLLFGPRTASAATEPRKVVLVLIDVSKSTPAEGLAANIAAAAGAFNRLQPGDRIVVIGITDDFSHPLVVMDREMPPAGYLSLQLKAARELALAEWNEKSKGLKPTFRRTDILGALMFAAYLTDTWSNRELFVFSDLRQDSDKVSFERVPVVDVDKAINKARTAGLEPELAGSKVFLLGADASGVSATHFASLKRFWTKFFAEIKAQVVTFSPGRRIPDVVAD